jgi:glycosyltransferase involved in cell wall biosynthesis
VIDLHAARVTASLPGLVRYLRRERPMALLSSLVNANLVALWAKKIAGVSTRVVLRIDSPLSHTFAHPRNLRGRLMPALLRRSYTMADAVVAVSHGVADDFVRTIRAPRERIRVIHNPVVTEHMLAESYEPVEHPWFAEPRVPIVLAVGRLTAVKDYPTLLRAFARVRAQRDVRLLILGEGEERGKLTAQVRALRMDDAVAMPGFVDNPYAYMRNVQAFVLSSSYEGFGNVLAEAMACGTPVMSTDCPGGPGEILERGRWGALAPVGDDTRLAEAMLATLDNPIPAALLRQRSQAFSAETILDQYVEVLCGVA